MLLTFVTAIPVLADNTPANVQAALRKMYPTAQNVAWTMDEAYHVADFTANGFNMKVWFGVGAQWAMKQTDWETMDEVPDAVYNAFAGSQYSSGMVQNVVLVQFPKRPAVVSVVVGMANTQAQYQLLFSLDGELEDERDATYFNNLLGAEVFLSN